MYRLPSTPRMVEICASRESRIISARRFCLSRPSKRLYSSRAASSLGSSSLSLALAATNDTPRKPATARQSATEPTRNGSLTLAKRLLARSPTSFRPPEAALRFWPGRRLTVIIMGGGLRASGSCGGTERQPDRQHQERRDLVHVHGREDALRDLQPGQRVGQFD